MKKFSLKVFHIIRSNQNDLILILTFVLIGVFTRTVLHIIPNLEFVTAISITAGFLVKKKKLAFIVPLFTMLFSDLLIGNTIIFVFTWTGFLAPVLIGFVLQKIKSMNYIKLGLLGGLGGLISTLIFFLWTNFGVVLVTNMYSKDIFGVIASYISAIPFLRPQLIGNLILVPVILISTKLLLSKNEIFASVRKIALRGSYK